MKKERDKAKSDLCQKKMLTFVGNKNEFTGQSNLKIIKKLQTFLLENVK